MDIEILVFEIDGQRFGVRSADVVEVLQAATLSPLPQAPATIEGVLSLRGRVVPVLDTRRAVGLPAKRMQHTDHLIVVRAGGWTIALRADRATNLMRLERPASAAEAEAKLRVVEFVARTSLGLVFVLDLALLLSDPATASTVKGLAQRGNGGGPVNDTVVANGESKSDGLRWQDVKQRLTRASGPGRHRATVRRTVPSGHG